MLSAESVFMQIIVFGRVSREADCRLHCAATAVTFKLQAAAATCARGTSQTKGVGQSGGKGAGQVAGNQPVVNSDLMAMARGSCKWKMVDEEKGVRCEGRGGYCPLDRT